MSKGTFHDVEDLARDLGLTVRSYSGRGMYGKECVGITTDDPDEIVASCREHGLSIPARDSMGLKTICYWPNIPAAMPVTKEQP